MPNKRYSQFTALKALTKGSFAAMLKSPSALFFSIAFPLLFIIAFGVMSEGGFSLKMAFHKKADTLNPFALTLKNIPTIQMLDYDTEEKKLEDLKKGKIAAIVSIKKQDPTIYKVPYQIELQSSLAAGNDRLVAKQMIASIVDTLNRMYYPNNQTMASISEKKLIEGRPYKYLDFFLPGMLGFSLMSAGIFGTSFLFFTLRQNLVLKRFYATPVKRIHIIISEGLSRLFLQILSAAIIIGVGYLAFHFTLVHGWYTFFQMIALSVLGLILFLGMGFVISSLAKNDAMIPPLANMITMPQLLLSGVFLSTSNFPNWLQPICNFLPLTQLNNAMRAIAFEGKTLLQCWMPIGILCIWIILVYAIAVKVFRWD
ncbi:MAG: ABC transporter permease [Chitinophagaceae bacterium]